MIRITFIGPLPPPVNGLSAISQQMFGRLRNKAAVTVYDRGHPHDYSTDRLVTGPARILVVLRSACHFAWSCFTKRPDALYIALSGGSGRAFDAIFILVGRIFSVRTFVHHHSFAYILESDALGRLITSCGPTAYHIVLCHDMGRELCSKYAIDPSRIFCLSNAAFVSPNVPKDNNIETETAVLNVGFLGNITEDKGIFDFIESVREARSRGSNFKAYAAGPIAPDIVDAVTALFDAPDVQVHHLGPIYGDRKEAYLQSLDILLFPSRYKNEAEPVTIWEALSTGTVVVASQRGCVVELLNQVSGKCVPIDAFVSKAAETIKFLSEEGHETRRLAKAAVREKFEHARTQSCTSLNRLLLKILVTQKK